MGYYISIGLLYAAIVTVAAVVGFSMIEDRVSRLERSVLDSYRIEGFAGPADMPADDPWREEHLEQ